MKIFISQFYNSLLKLFLIYLSALLIFTLFRITILCQFGDFGDISNYKLDLLHSFWVGFRFDTCILAYGLLPVVAFGLVNSIFLGINLKFKLNEQLFLKSYATFMIFIFIFLQILDFYFYKFFQSHFNSLVFGIIQDDTAAVLDSVWTDYPIIKICLLILFLLYIFNKIIAIISNLKFELFYKNFKATCILIIVLIPIYILALRGSIGTFPIETDDTAISPNTFINNLTMNGVFALKVAFEEQKKQTIHTDIDKTLKSYGFNNANEAVSSYLDTIVDSKIGLENYLESKTKENEFLKKNPPNVIFIQMESMSNYYLDLHSKELNLLGSLENQLPHCYLFRNFLSCCNGTIHSLEGLMVNTPMTPISQSSYLNVPLKSSVALPFKQNGYSTHFITGAKMGWRNLDKFIPNQYFDICEGSATLIEKVKNAQKCEWGTFDEYLFDRMFDVLNQKSTSPKFIFAMTTTNHTPFELPTTYKKPSIKLNKNITKRIRVNEDIAKKNFTNYRYANECLGNFIQKVRNSPLGKNTIIVATGDHNTLQVFDFNDSEMLQRYSVPLIMYLPDLYKPKNKVDTSRFGSHKDIFPTIFNYSLSNTTYLKSGNNLLEEQNNTYYFSANNYYVGMDKNGCVLLNEKPLFFKWKSSDRKHLEPCLIEQKPELNKLYNTLNGHVASLDFYIQTLLINKNK